MNRVSCSLSFWLVFFATLVTCSNALFSQQSETAEGQLQSPPAALKVEASSPVLRDVAFDLKIQALDQKGNPDSEFSGSVTLQGVTVEDESGNLETVVAVSLAEGTATVSGVRVRQTGEHVISASANGTSAQATIRVIPGFLSLLPPLIAIGLAFLTREVLISLFAGIWLGALLIFNYNPILALLRTVDNYLINALADSNNASILIFSMTLGGMVGVIAKAGGTQGIVQKLSKYAKHARGGQLATWAMGVLIFFDDYANSLIVGNTMRPFTDRLRISREKLSYIVDSTAAPVASIALISTWIGFQVGLIDQAAKGLGIQENAYQMFLASIPHATYSILALVFVFLIGSTLRDFGPMRTAELRATQSGQVLRDGAQPLTDSTSLDMVADKGTPLRWYNALIPILAVIVTTFVGLYLDGRATLGDEASQAPLGTIFGEANSFAVLLWASFTGLFVASVLAIGQKILSLKETVAATINGYKSMLLACMILVMAWAIGNLCKDLHTADYVIATTKGILSPRLIPFITFLAAAFIAFSTGTSWATMAILTPIVVPIAFKFPAAAGMTGEINHDILIATIGAVLSGSVLGDHCSPISDTTILSSMASAADHVDHVRTQMPYALSVGLVASLVGYIPSGWGFNAVASILIGSALLTGFIFVMGKKQSAAERVQHEPKETVDV